MKRMAVLSATMLALSAAGLRADLTDHDPNIHDSNNDAWAENMGWTTWEYVIASVDAGVSIGRSYVAGYIWAENVGWIHLGDGSPADGCAYANDSATDYGVNILKKENRLKGYAWGENIGWIHFFGSDDITGISDTERPRIDRDDPYRLEGYAWGENVGWINLDDATYFVAVEDYSCTCGDYPPTNDTVDYADIQIFETCYLQCGPTASCTLKELYCSDLNTDGHVGRVDASYMGRLVGETTRTESPPDCAPEIDAVDNCAAW